MEFAAMKFSSVVDVRVMFISPAHMWDENSHFVSSIGNLCDQLIVLVLFLH
jgi:hypothetical protein